MEQCAFTQPPCRVAAAPLGLALTAMLLCLAGQAQAAEITPADLDPGPAAGGACDRTTAAVARACPKDAAADYLVTLAACANFGTSAARDRCERQANRNLAAAQAECDGQQEARARVCQALGQAPYDPVIRPSEFSANITNPFFPLPPGRVLVYRAPDAVITVTVTSRTVKIAGVTCRVVRDTKVVDGKVEEDTLDYYSQDRAGNVWYFGEATAEFLNGVPVNTDGSFVAGIDHAKPGIIMKAAPRPGVTYRQEFLLTDAEDLARIEALGTRVSVPYGTFSNALKTFEFTPLEPDARENKYYVPGVGNVLTINLENGEREELVRVSG